MTTTVTHIKVFWLRLKQLSNMKQNRELDQMVALKVMGYKWIWVEYKRLYLGDPKEFEDSMKLGHITEYTIIEDTPYLEKLKSECKNNIYRHLPHFSSYIQRAWMVIEMLCKKGAWPRLHFDGVGWQIQLFRPRESFNVYIDPMEFVDHSGGDLPLVICEAAIEWAKRCSE